MKTFDDWVNETVQKLAPLLAPEPELPENVDQMADGTLKCECSCCGEWFDLDIDPSEVHTAGDEYGRFYCGSSPRCCP